MRIREASFTVRPPRVGNGRIWDVAIPFSPVVQIGRAWGIVAGKGA